MDIGSVVPHPVLGYIWVTLGEVKRGIGGNARECKVKKWKQKRIFTAFVGNQRTARECPSMLS
jgi:hypothetical protein